MTKSFPVLHGRNSWLFFIGHLVSQMGTWMNAAAMAWLVLQLTDSGTAVGIAVALQAAPILFLGPVAGVFVDRISKYRLLLWTQTTMGCNALILGVLTVTGLVNVWHVYALSLIFGIGRCFEIPGRQAFVTEIVGRDLLRNGITLQAMVNNAARIAGPALAGIIIAVVGTWLCFLLNAASYLCIAGLFLAMDRAKLIRQTPAARARGQLREGLRHARRDREVRSILAMMVAGGIFIQQYQTILPVLAKRTFDGGPQALGLLMSGLGVGAILGGFVVARTGWTGVRKVGLSFFASAVALGLTAVMPTLLLAAGTMILFGVANIWLLTTANASIQLSAAPNMQGRLVALFASANLGSTALGGPVMGWLCDVIGARYSLVVAAVAATLIGGYGMWASRRTRAARSSDADAPAMPGEPGQRDATLA